ncbi:MAG: hypothetical protein ACLFP4_02970 [Spirochaetales bacterium]
MTRVRAATASLLFFMSAATAATVELEDVLQALLDQALTVQITARVTENGEETVQSYDLTRVTISGRAVRLRLEGGNLTIIAEFTPFEDEEGILLVAEGRIFLRTEESEEVQYRTSLRSIPLSLGESVVFYPLGKSTFDMDLETEQSDDLNVELEVEVRPYEGERG